MRLRNRPLTLRLPFAFVDRHLCLEQILAADASRSWAQSWWLLPCFALSRPETQFARRLLDRKRNIWLFRCNQRAFCGDFIAVDMSVCQPRLRTAVIVELKSGAALRLGGAGAGNQFQRASAAVAELAEIEKVIVEDAPVSMVTGDGEFVARWLEDNGR